MDARRTIHRLKSLTLMLLYPYHLPLPMTPFSLSLAMSSSLIK